MSRKRKYEIAYDHDLRDALSQLALTMNTPRKVDFVRTALRDFNKDIRDALLDIKPTAESCPSDLICGYKVLDFLFAIGTSKQIHAHIEFTKDMRLALERFVAPLGDHDSALLASESASWFNGDDFAFRTHGMSFSDEKVSRETHSALCRLEVAIREAIEGKQEGTR